MEKSYDLGNQELLQVVLALYRWHHWLDGSQQLKAGPMVPFLESFKHPLFYSPGSHNDKPDALSQLYSSDSVPTDPEPIMPSLSLV